MARGKNYTREITTGQGDLLYVKVSAESNKVVALGEAEVGYANSLDPKAAHQLGEALIYAARLAAMNMQLEPSTEVVNNVA